MVVAQHLILLGVRTAILIISCAEKMKKGLLKRFVFSVYDLLLFCKLETALTSMFVFVQNHPENPSHNQSRSTGIRGRSAGGIG